VPYWDPRGVWQGIVRYGGRKIKKAFPQKRDARTWEIATRRELEEAEAQKTSKTATDMDFLTFSNSYLDDAKLRYTVKTYKEKKSLCKKLVKLWGALSVQEITPEMIRQYLNQQAEARSVNCYNRDRKNLMALWTWGQEILEFPTNPVAKIKRLPHERKVQYTPPTQDILRVISAAKREERIFLNAYLHTGARRSEIFRWTWADDINFEKREVRLGTRKTKDGSMEFEWLPMSNELYEELWSWWKNRPVKDSPFVFVSTSNRHYGQPFTTRRRFMKGLCERAKVKPFGFHALRRYVASLLADTHKVSSKTIQRILRHKHVTTTERYIQNINQDLKSVMDLLAKKGPHDGPHKTKKSRD
jgi:integrase